MLAYNLISQYGRHILKKWNLSRTFAVLFMIGFLVGIVYTNLFAKSYVLSMGIFSDLFLKRFSEMDFVMEEFILYIVKIRVVPVLFLIILGCTKYKKISASFCLLWTGFSFGLIMTTAVFKLNIKGILLCIIGLCPHFICYAAAYVMLLIYLFEYPGVRWNHSKTISFVLFILLGIITECYINPIMMNVFIQTL